MRVDGLKPDVNYCFVLLAVVVVDQVAPSDEVCTARPGGPAPSTAQSSRPAGSTRGG